MPSPEIFVGMPVYQGHEFVAESLRSLRDQTFENWRLLISVDGDDQVSADACRPFLQDPRVRLVVQETRLGWAPHLNWLFQQCDCPYFCFWQQDDLAATNFLDRLQAMMIDRPDTSVAFSDIQWFSAEMRRDTGEDIVGTPAQRYLRQMERFLYEPLLGLIRTEHLRKAPGIRVSAHDSSHQEQVLIAELAIHGSLRRVPDTLYFKRRHPKNTFSSWDPWPLHRRREVWVDSAVSFWRGAQSVDSLKSRPFRLAATILDRFLIPRPLRGFYYDPPSCDHAIQRFVRDFVSKSGWSAIHDSFDSEADSSLTDFCPPIDNRVATCLSQQQQAEKLRQSWHDELKATGQLTLDIHEESQGTSLLGYGWSQLEPWGVWTEQPTATLRLPALPKGQWHLRMSGNHLGHAELSEARVLWSTSEGGPWTEARVPTNTPVEIDIHCQVSQANSETQIHLQLPDAFVPREHNVCDDARFLGWGITGIQLQKVTTPLVHRFLPHRRGSTGSLSSASTPKTHS